MDRQSIVTRPINACRKGDADCTAGVAKHGTEQGPAPAPVMAARGGSNMTRAEWKSTQRNPMQPLSGMTVIEAGAYITAPYAAMMLADMGAQVIKVERPGGGDPFRRFDGDTYRPYFRSANRTKKSVVVDIRKPEGKEIFRKLAAGADLIIENNRPGVMDKLGLGYEELSKLNSRLVYCSITGFGNEGPYRDRPAFDTVGQALSGLLSLQVDPENPRLTGAAVGDGVTGLYACYAALSGLMQRERTGKGCRVETSMLAAGMSFLEFWFVDYYANKVLPNMYRKSQINLSFGLRASDGKMLIIHLSSLPKFWEGLLIAIEAPQFATDPRFSTRPNRIENYELLRAELSAIFSRRPRAYWLEVLTANDIPNAPIYTFDEHASDPQVKHLGLLYELKHKNPKADPTTMLKRAVLIDGQTGFEDAVAPPLLGEHTFEVLKSYGYSDADLEKLATAAIIERYKGA